CEGRRAGRCGRCGGRCGGGCVARCEGRADRTSALPLRRTQPRPVRAKGGVMRRLLAAVVVVGAVGFSSAPAQATSCRDGFELRHTKRGWKCIPTPTTTTAPTTTTEAPTTTTVAPTATTTEPES